MEEYKGMKRSLGQSIYKFLPGMWVGYSPKKNTTILIKYWYHNKVENIYNSFLEQAIKKQINDFGNAGGNVSAFNSEGDMFDFVEPPRMENATDIYGEVSPLFYYCDNPNCGKAYVFKKEEEVIKTNWKCKCGGHLKQLQMVYACECGAAKPVCFPNVAGVKDFYYKPNENKYVIYYKQGNLMKYIPLLEKCDNCKNPIKIETAESAKNFIPKSVNVINLLNKKSGDFYEKGEKAQKIVLAKWFNQITQEEYDDIINDVEFAFNKKMTIDYKNEEIYKQTKALVDAGFIPAEKLDEAVNQIMSMKNDKCVDTYVASIDQILRTIDVDSNFSISDSAYYLMQYDTVKSCATKITYDKIVDYHMKAGFIDDQKEIEDLHKVLGIKNVQASCNVEIVNSTYGFTRKAINPSENMNKKTALKLNAFDKNKDGSRNLAYTSVLETEGLLFNIDMVKILEWLRTNNIITDAQMPDDTDDISIKKWFMENVDTTAPNFEDISDAKPIFKNVYSLLHSISHAFIKAIGEISGLGTNSLSEVLFPQAGSIFIYAQTTQGVPLGAISGMAESKYVQFLNIALKDNRECAFDPICSERDYSACGACIQLPEITCRNFNYNLGRDYLYTLKENKIGFWEM